MGGNAAFTVPDGAPDIVKLATTLWGEPTGVKPEEVRFGANGSKCVKPAPENIWTDHEAGTGGGYLDLYKLAFGAMPDKPKPATRGGIVATYDYLDEAGALLFQVCRLEPKSFRQRRPDTSGPSGWSWSVKGVRRIPYRLSDVIAAPADGVVYIPEGEKDVDNLRRLGLVATCNAGGAMKWHRELSSHLAGRHVVILPDNDQAGADHARDVAGKLVGIAASVRVLDLPGLPPKGDVSDWLSKGGTAEELIRLAREAPEAKPEQDAEGAPATEAVAANDDAIPPQFTDESLALRFSARHSDRLRYVAAWGKWLVREPAVWRFDGTLQAFDLARAVCREASAETDKERIAAAVASAKTVAAVERLAKADRRHAATVEQWDADPWLLNTPGGVIDLRSGKMHRHRAEHFMTKMTAVAPEGECPLWLRFLARITEDNQDLVDFLQRAAGYMLTGSTRDHALFFGYGSGGNGKGVFTNTLSAILHDYSAVAEMATFAASHNDRHPTDLAMLRGARLVTAQETEEGRQWAEARIKALTGGDPISARFMRQDFFTFVPQFKLFIAGNHKPGLRNVDDAMRRRFHMIPFNAQITAAERDPDLPEKLRAEWPGILRWMITGCIAWQRDGLAPPKIVQDATAEYFEAQDFFGRWLAECCDLHPTLSVPPAVLLRSFQDWCRENGEDSSDNRRLRGLIEKTPGLRYVTTHGKQLVRGISPKPEPDNRYGPDT